MTTTTEICFLSLHQLAGAVRAREISPVEATTAVLERIERLNPKLNAYITVMADQALADARSAAEEIASGGYRGPLHGVPVAVKDLCQTAGVRTTAGSKILGDWLPEADATVIRRLREAGAVIVGKTNLHEFAFGATGLNQYFGPARNPWNAAYITGGSSSGSGAAVAAGLCFAALGSDTGGSIRIPSALCGIAGIKATQGRVSLTGVVPLSWTLDHVGPMARTVRDCAIVLEAIAGHDATDPESAGAPVEAWSSTLDMRELASPPPAKEDFVPRMAPIGESHAHSKLLGGVRVGVPSRAMDDTEPDVARAVRDGIGALERLGATVREVELPMLDEYWNLTSVVLLAEAAAYHKEDIEKRPEDYADDVRQRVQAGLAIPVADYASAARRRDEIRVACDEMLLSHADVLAMPTSRLAAVPIDEASRDDPTLGLTRLTGQFDLTGQPAMSVPCGLTERGLPVGLQIVGRRFDERTVLRVANAFETEGGVSLPRPPVE